MVYIDPTHMNGLATQQPGEDAGRMPIRKTGVPPHNYEQPEPYAIIKDMFAPTARLVIPIDQRSRLPDVARMLRWLADQIDQSAGNKMKSNYESHRDVYWATRSFNRACRDLSRSSVRK